MRDPFITFLDVIETDCQQVGCAIADQYGPSLVAERVSPEAARAGVTAMITQSTQHMRSMLRGRGWANKKQRRLIRTATKSGIVAGFDERYREMLSAQEEAIS